jgi:hypothetical protein
MLLISRLSRPQWMSRAESQQEQDLSRRYAQVHGDRFALTGLNLKPENGVPPVSLLCSGFAEKGDVLQGIGVRPI